MEADAAATAARPGGSAAGSPQGGGEGSPPPLHRAEASMTIVGEATSGDSDGSGTSDADYSDDGEAASSDSETGSSQGSEDGDGEEEEGDDDGEGEGEVDVELDRALQAKASKFNLSASNVRELLGSMLRDPSIRHILTRMEGSADGLGLGGDGAAAAVVDDAGPVALSPRKRSRRREELAARQQAFMQSLNDAQSVRSGASDASDDEDFVPGSDDGEEEDDEASDAEDMADLLTAASTPATDVWQLHQPHQPQLSQQAAGAATPLQNVTGLQYLPSLPDSLPDLPDLDLQLAKEAVQNSSRDGILADLVSGLDNLKPGTMALRTRSKNPLEQISLQDLEAVLQTAPALPDAAKDMDDDQAQYQRFIFGLQPGVTDTWCGDEGEDDNESEYDYAADAKRVLFLFGVWVPLVMKEINEEFRTDQSVEITEKELKALKTDGASMSSLSKKSNRFVAAKIPQVKRGQSQSSFSLSQLQSLAQQLKLFMQLGVYMGITSELAESTCELSCNTEREKQARYDGAKAKAQSRLDLARTEPAKEKARSQLKRNSELWQKSEDAAQKCLARKAGFAAVKWETYGLLHAWNQNLAARGQGLGQRTVFDVPGLSRLPALVAPLQTKSPPRDKTQLQQQLDAIRPHFWYKDIEVFRKTTRVSLEQRASSNFTEAEDMVLALGMAQYAAGTTQALGETKNAVLRMLEAIRDQQLFQRDLRQLKRRYYSTHKTAGSAVHAMIKKGNGAAFRDQFLRKFYEMFAVPFPQPAKGPPNVLARASVPRPADAVSLGQGAPPSAQATQAATTASTALRTDPATSLGMDPTTPHAHGDGLDGHNDLTSTSSPDNDGTGGGPADEAAGYLDADEEPPAYADDNDDDYPPEAPSLGLSFPPGSQHSLHPSALSSGLPLISMSEFPVTPPRFPAQAMAPSGRGGAASAALFNLAPGTSAGHHLPPVRPTVQAPNWLGGLEAPTQHSPYVHSCEIRNDLTKDGCFEEATVPEDAAPLASRGTIQEVPMRHLVRAARVASIAFPDNPPSSSDAQPWAGDGAAWTREEDRAILLASKKKVPWASVLVGGGRTPQQLEGRFRELLRLFKKKKRRKGSDS